MLVPTMSLTEIKKSVINDYRPEVKNKVETIKIAYKAKWIREGRKDFVETINFPVKSKNNWRITILCVKGNISTIPYLISYDKYGITATLFLTEFVDDQMLHFNAHFFKRFRERGKIDIDKPDQVIKLFFRKNQFLVPCYSPRDDGTQQLFVPLLGGVGLGNYHLDNNICEFKTFVDNSLLGKNQLTEISEIYSDTMTEIMAEIQRRIDKRAKKI
jgi:hypothetical protein